MPSPRKPSQDVMIIIGQLLAATQAAGDGLKATNAEIQANGKALIAAVKTLELIEETVAELDRLVRTGNGDSIITRLAVLKAEVLDLQKQVSELEGRVHTTAQQLTDLDLARNSLKTGKHLILELVKAFGWIATTAIALYAAFKG